ncbi:hypothetical protein GCM10022254_58870 [Actinomadura meridiana]|uniref:HTH araC/xylS-type domain-containing protein n=1 Tax=Actinomadura meridiana TaxID=559626 RepID=A0ABP8CHW8_9ACTN
MHGLADITIALRSGVCQGGHARGVGYEDAFAFSAAFKRAHGVSPSVRRRRAGAA